MPNCDQADRDAAAVTTTAPRVAVIFDNFGPYHIARLSAAAKVLDVLAIEVGGNSAEYAWDRPESAGLQRIALFPGASQSVPRAVIAKAVAAALTRAKPDAIAIPGWSDVAALAALRWGRRHSVPVIVMSESNQADHGRNALGEFVKRRIVQSCAAGLAGGRRAAAYLAALGMPQARIAIGYDVIDNGYFTLGAARTRRDPHAAREALGVPERFFLTCCRLIDKKNIAVLLEALAAYRRATPAEAAWSLVIAGDGPLRPALEAQARALGIADAVHFAGFVQYDALPTYYGLASAFILPSTTEQWGLVVNEAMAAELPVLVSARCGCADDLVVDGENGVLLDPSNAAGMAQQLYRVAHDSDLAAMGRRSAEIVADFGSDRFAGGLRAAVDAAAAGPVRTTLIGRALVTAMLR